METFFIFIFLFPVNTKAFGCNAKKMWKSCTNVNTFAGTIKPLH